MAKYSTKECYKCHLRRPVTEMRSKSMETRTGSSFGIYNISSGSKRKGSARVLFSKKTVWYCSPSSACNDPQYFERMAAEINLLEERVSNLNKLAVDSKNYLPSSIEYLKKNPIQDYQLYFIEIESVLDGFSDSYPELSDEILQIKSNIPHELSAEDLVTYLFSPNINKNANIKNIDKVFEYKKPDGNLKKINVFFKKVNEHAKHFTFFYNPIWGAALVLFFIFSYPSIDLFKFFALGYSAIFIWRFISLKSKIKSSHRRFVYNKINGIVQKFKYQLATDTAQLLGYFDKQILKLGKSYNLNDWDAFEEYSELDPRANFLEKEEKESLEQDTVYSAKSYQKNLDLSIKGGLIGMNRAYLSKTKIEAIFAYIKITTINILSLIVAYTTTTPELAIFPLYIWALEVLMAKYKLMRDSDGLMVVPDEMRIVTYTSETSENTNSVKVDLPNTLNFTVGKNRSVQRTIKDFTEQFGVAIRIYKGKRMADGKLKISVISDINLNLKTDIEILKTTTVGDLEDHFYNLCGLAVQIENKSGSLANNSKIFFNLVDVV
ncbi:hypothetical protein HN615_06155 [Candidatus Woesearchaeota archaeon]|jgi:hypothetical protein|nr:hypothetical protein [Candidatus Woesearchaeota archaeon]